MGEKYKNKINKYLINILLSLFAIIIFFIIFEIISSITNQTKSKNLDNAFDESPIRIKNINKNSLILNTLKPNSSMYLAGAYVKINSLGFRDYEYSIKKPEDTFRIVVLGDSFTFGYGVNINETYVKQLEVLLNKKYEKNIEVLNFGGNGGNTLLEVDYLRERVLDFEPDFVLILVGFTYNDVDTEYISDKEFCLNNNLNLSVKHNFITKTQTYNLLSEKYDNIGKKLNYNKFYETTINITDNEKIDAGYYFFSIYNDNYPGLNCFKEGLKRFSEI